MIENIICTCTLTKLRILLTARRSNFITSRLGQLDRTAPYTRAAAPNQYNLSKSHRLQFRKRKPQLRGREKPNRSLTVAFAATNVWNVPQLSLFGPCGSKTLGAQAARTRSPVAADDCGIVVDDHAGVLYDGVCGVDGYGMDADQDFCWGYFRDRSLGYREVGALGRDYSSFVGLSSSHDDGNGGFCGKATATR
ncbi:hypothetical protein KC338_g309 [Hortaea werneckii]|nr:hypothetical protein KC338_g309 [Hortaea werneckii]